MNGRESAEGHRRDSQPRDTTETPSRGHHRREPAGGTAASRLADSKPKCLRQCHQRSVSKTRRHDHSEGLVAPDIRSIRH